MYIVYNKYYSKVLHYEFAAQMEQKCLCKKFSLTVTRLGKRAHVLQGVLVEMDLHCC